MTINEFIKLTGFHPDAEEYRIIEEEYYKFPGDKFEFCKKWKRNGGVLSSSERTNLRMIKLKDSYGELETILELIKTENENLKKEINELNECINYIKSSLRVLAI